MQTLRKGYTTGVHASFAFKCALDSFLCTSLTSISKTNKMDNDDIDVTKGCEIVVIITKDKNELHLNPIFQTPQLFTCRGSSIEIYAGKGVGVVTKKGLKIAPNFPAINPVPLDAMKKAFEKLCKDKKDLKLYCSISITDGEELAKQSANSKVGVLGGLSILGTKGIVKPISSAAYMDSVETEIGFANQNGYTPLVFTLGNLSLEYARKYYDDEQIIEVGNFVYDSFKIADSLKVKNVLFICGIGKMTKIAQGFKNTHNRFGVIDFELLKKRIKSTFNVQVDTKSTLTVKGISQQLKELNLKDEFYKMVEKDAQNEVSQWFEQMKIQMEVIYPS